MKLYEIKQQYRNLLDIQALDEYTNNQDVIDALEKIEEDFEEKAVSVVYAIKNYESEANAIDTEIKRLTALKTARTKRAESLKGYLKTQMQAVAGEEKYAIKTPLFNISLSAPKLSAVEIQVPVEQLPMDYLRIKTEPNKERLKEDLLNGIEIQGVSLAESRTLTIR